MSSCHVNLTLILGRYKSNIQILMGMVQLFRNGTLAPIQNYLKLILPSWFLLLFKSRYKVNMQIEIIIQFRNTITLALIFATEKSDTASMKFELLNKMQGIFPIVHCMPTRYFWVGIVNKFNAYINFSNKFENEWRMKTMRWKM